MSNCLRLGQHVQTRGDVPIKTLRRGYRYATLQGVITALEPTRVRVRVSEPGEHWPVEPSFAYHDLQPLSPKA